MSVKNTRPGIWITFRCNKCSELRRARKADLYITIDAAWEDAVAAGWRSAPDHESVDGSIICPPCVGGAVR